MSVLLIFYLYVKMIKITVAFNGGEALGKKYNYFDDTDTSARKDKKLRFDKMDISDFLSRLQSKERSEKAKIVEDLRDAKQIVGTNKRVRVTALAVCIIVVIVLLVVVVAVKFSSENRRIEQFKADAGEVCAKYAADYGNCSYEGVAAAESEGGYRMTGLCYAREMDFDNDGTSELLVAYRDNGIYYADIWGYKKKHEFEKLYHQKAAQTTDKASDVWITLYYHRNIYYIGNHSGENLSKVDLYTLKGAKFKNKKSATFDSNSQSFKINEKNGDFEMIRLSVLTESRATKTADLINSTVGGFTRSSENSTIKTVTGQSLNDAYFELVNEYTKKYGSAELKKSGSKAYINGLAVVKLVDFNNDNVSELMLIYRRAVKIRSEDSDGNCISKNVYRYNCDIYSYNGSSAELVYQNQGSSNTLNDSDEIYFMLKHQNNIQYICINDFDVEDYGRTINASSSMYSFNGKNFKRTYDAKYKKEYGYLKYYIDGERVYNSEFEEKGYEVPFFNGNTDYDDDVYDVIRLQSDTKNSDALQQAINSTGYTVNELNK